MTPIQLKALRQFLFFTVPEAAALLATTPERPQGVTARTWRHWESGRNVVPGYVAAAVADVLTWRQDYIEDIKRAHRAAIGQSPGGSCRTVLTWYETADEWAADNLYANHWRPCQSALAELAATEPQILLKRYTPPSVS